MRQVGDVAQALYSAAAVPGTVKEFCRRACVGYAVGRYTASRMVQRGELVQAPAMNALPCAAAAAGPVSRGRRPVLLVAAQPRTQGQPGLWAQQVAA